MSHSIKQINLFLSGAAAFALILYCCDCIKSPGKVIDNKNAVRISFPSVESDQVRMNLVDEQGRVFESYPIGADCTQVIDAESVRNSKIRFIIERGNPKKLVSR